MQKSFCMLYDTEKYNSGIADSIEKFSLATLILPLLQHVGSASAFLVIQYHWS